MTVKTFHQLSKELAPFVLCDIDQTSLELLVPVLHKYGLAYTQVSFQDHARLSLLLDKEPCLLLCNLTDGGTPTAVENAKIPTIVLGADIPNINSYKCPLLCIDKSNLDVDVCDFFVGRIWATRIEKFQQELRIHWEGVKKKSNRELKKNFESLVASDSSKKEFWTALSHISSRLLGFLKVQIDSSKSLSASIENYLEGHPDLECIYKGNFLDSSTLPTSNR